MKKLTLKKVTVANLQKQEMAKANGGAIEATEWDTCWCWVDNDDFIESIIQSVCVTCP